MQPKIGIARALYSYYHYPLFNTFFASLDTSVILSPQTSKVILNSGIECSPAEICLPVKAFLGHVTYLKDKVDYLFIPRIVCIKEKRKIRFGCPKAIVLPDLIKSTFDRLPPILELTWDERIGTLKNSFSMIGKILLKNNRESHNAYKLAQIAQSKADRLLKQGFTPDQIFQEAPATSQPNSLAFKPKLKPIITDQNNLTIGLVGHPYLLFDNELSLGIIDQLEKLGATVLTPSILTPETISHSIAKTDDLTWFYEKEILGSAAYFLNNKNIDGLLLVTSFACGTGAVVNEIIYRELARYSHVPILTLLLDEHSAETGVMTRLESFIDLISLSKKTSSSGKVLPRKSKSKRILTEICSGSELRQ
jgi:predicted nucleotide-binding protein (sugar kinase/HSP70/actin superfamily)